MRLLDVIRSLLPPSAKSLAFRLLCNDLTGSLIRILFRGRIPHSTGRIRVDKSVVSGKWTAAIFFRLYERVELFMIERFLRPDLDVIELGGSIGVTARSILRRTGAGKKAVVVEANPELIPLLTANTGDWDNVTILNKALMPATGASVYFVRGDTNLNGRVSDVPVDASVRIEGTTLGKLIDEHELGRFALVSDIEGAEAFLLEHELDRLEQCEQVIMELDLPGEDERERAIQTLTKAGFSLAYRWGNCVCMNRTGPNAERQT